MSTVTRRQAELVLVAVLLRYRHHLAPVLGEDGSVLILAPGPLDQPALIEREPGRFEIVWESGPFEWAYRFTMGGVNAELAAALHHEFGHPAAEAGRRATEEPAVLPKSLAAKVHLECATSYALALYPA